jgi:hypothetical protein
MGKEYSTHGAKINVYRVYVGVPEEKRPHEIPRRRWGYNIKSELR